MGLDTEVPGSPSSIEASAQWLSGTLAPSVAEASDALLSARGDAESDWDGQAGSTFASTMRSASGKADDLNGSARGVAEGLDAYATSLRSAQHGMADIRSAAQGAGLAVNGLVIEEPGAGPSRPTPMTVTSQTPPGAISAHDASVAAFDAHQEKIRAWNKAVADVRDVRTQLTGAGDTLSDRYRGLAGAQWVLTAADIAGGVSGAALEYNASALRQTSHTFSSQAARDLDRALKADPAIVGKARWYQDLDAARNLGSTADDMAKTAEALDHTSKTLPLKAGGALAALGIGYDIYNGKDPVQAVASGGGGGRRRRSRDLHLRGHRLGVRERP